MYNVKISNFVFVAKKHKLRTLVLTTAGIFLLTPGPTQCPTNRKSTRANFANGTTFLLDTSP